MWQFILDICWYGNANLSSLQMVSLSIGIVIATVGFSSSLSSGKLKHKPQRIQDITPNQHAIATGTISADTPIEKMEHTTPTFHRKTTNLQVFSVYTITLAKSIYYSMTRLSQCLQMNHLRRQFCKMPPYL